MVGLLSLTAAGKLAVVDGRRRARVEIGAKSRGKARMDVVWEIRGRVRCLAF